MFQQDAMLAAICADVDDDQVRLVYADWLEEQGDPRGELIRVEIEYARLPWGDRRREPLKRREQELLAKHSHRWRPPRLAGVAWGPFERGFVESVSLESWQAFVRHVDVLGQLTPIRSLRIAQVMLTAGQISALAAWPRLGRLSRLELEGGGLGEEEIQILVGSPYLANLKGLSLADNELRDAGAERLAASPFLCGLSSLNLAWNRIGPSGVNALQSSLYLRDVRDLDLTGNEFAGHS